VSDKVVLPAWQIEQANTHTQHACNHVREPDEESSQQELVTLCTSVQDKTQQQASANECLGGTAQSVHLAEGSVHLVSSLLLQRFPWPAYVSAVMLTHA
jgi:hypothetical protein